MIVADLIGGILLFKFGLPEDINRKGHINLILEQTNEEEEKKAKRYDFLGKVGLIFIIIGFIFQLIGNFA